MKKAPNARHQPPVPKYVIEDFYGTVILKEWMTGIHGKQLHAITGMLTVVRDSDFGVSVRGNESNWGIRVIGPEREQWTILGCQIRAVCAHEPGANISPDTHICA